jgi:hypothetical protein
VKPTPPIAGMVRVDSLFELIAYDPIVIPRSSQELAALEVQFAAAGKRARARQHGSSRSRACRPARGSIPVMGATRLSSNFSARSLAGEPPRARTFGGSDTCGGLTLASRGWKGDGGIDVVDASGQARPLVTIVGRTRGFHDYLDTISDAGFTPPCKYVVFVYLRAVWVADAATGMVGHVIEGGMPRLLVTPMKTASPE